MAVDMPLESTLRRSWLNWGVSAIRIGDEPSTREIVAVVPHTLHTNQGAEDQSGHCRPTALAAQENANTHVRVGILFGKSFQSSIVPNRSCQLSIHAIHI